MSDPGADLPPPPGEQISGPVDPETPSPLRLLFQFFVVPATIVVAAVGVFVFFGWVATEEKSPADLLSKIQGSADETRRWQAAFQLSRALDSIPEGEEREKLANRISPILGSVEGKDEEANQLRRYLALTLGKLASPAGVEALLEVLDDDDPEARIYALHALARIGDRRALEPVLELCRSKDEEMRKIAAWTLGEITDVQRPGDPPELDPDARETLASLLNDSRVDVRWNAAVALSRVQDPAGVEILRGMLDRSDLVSLETTREDQVENALLVAIPAIVRLGDVASIPALEKLSEEDSSLKVRSEARKALEALGG